MPCDFSQPPALGASSLSNINIDIVTVHQMLANLREFAAGPNGIPDIFSKHLVYWLASSLAMVYQQLIHQARIPDDWRQAKEIHLFKGKEDKSNPSNYRPISLTVIACKILESIILTQISDYLENNILMCPQQHGFMSQRSTLSNLLLCDELITQYLNDRKPCDLFLLDFTRAFDKLSHNILQNKLVSLRVGGKLYQWLVDFLRDRSQFVSYCDISSESVPVKSSVIKGSVADPQLFNAMFSNLLQHAFSMGLILYTDDGKAIGSASSVLHCHNNQTDLDAIYH